MPVETFSEYAPFVRCAMPQANSTTSMPRAISPSASEVTLPCSEVRIAASSSLRAFSSSRNANITLCRFAIEASRQPSKAARAFATATSTSRRRCQPHVLLHDAARGVVDRCGAGGLARPRGAADPVVDRGNRGGRAVAARTRGRGIGHDDSFRGIGASDRPLRESSCEAHSAVRCRNSVHAPGYASACRPRTVEGCGLGGDARPDRQIATGRPR